MPKPTYTLFLIFITLTLSSCNYTGVTNRAEYIDARGLPVHQTSVAIQINYVPVCFIPRNYIPSPRRGDRHNVGDQAGQKAVNSLDWAMIREGQRVKAD